ncbi:MAG: zf-HC2 domain-containing protein [Nitrospirota bacterium]
MACKSKEIQALLPAHLEQSLDQESQAGVERHMAVCEDCRAELALLRMMSSEPVPDPGEAFWAAMPGRIFREVQAQTQQNASQGPRFGWGMLVTPRWAWAAAVIFLIAAVVLFLDRPVPVDIASNALPENGSSNGYLLPGDPIDLAELTDIEIDSVDLWATGELALLKDEVIDMFRTSADISLDDRLAELDTQELEHVIRMLDTQDEEG